MLNVLLFDLIFAIPSGGFCAISTWILLKKAVPEKFPNKNLVYILGGIYIAAIYLFLLSMNFESFSSTLNKWVCTIKDCSSHLEGQTDQQNKPSKTDLYHGNCNGNLLVGNGNRVKC